MAYRIFTDATSDITMELAKSLNVTVLPMEFTVGGQSQKHVPGDAGLNLKALFDAMRGGEQVVTSQINAFQFTEAFEPVLEAGEDLIHIGFSTALSGSTASGQLAVDELKKRYPERKIACIDSRAASLGEGLLVYYAARLQKELDFDQMVDWLEVNKQHFCHWFTVDDLVYLKRGGRVSGATAAIATVLNIKPAMHVNNEGQLIALDKVAGRKRSLKWLVDSMERTIDKEKADTVFVGHCDALEDAQFVAGLVKERFNIADIRIYDIGITIGAHSGPGTIALFHYGKGK